MACFVVTIFVLSQPLYTGRLWDMFFTHVDHSVVGKSHDPSSPNKRSHHSSVSCKSVRPAFWRKDLILSLCILSTGEETQGAGEVLSRLEDCFLRPEEIDANYNSQNSVWMCFIVVNVYCLVSVYCYHASDSIMCLLLTMIVTVPYYLVF